MTGSDVFVVLVTAPDDERGAELARDLVASGLVACVNRIGNVRSVYRWEGKVAEDAECLLVIKTTAACLGDLERRVRDKHPYDLPEFLALRADHGAADYLDWVRRETRRG
jgi:periplasmic divalent cation tolerance protein